MTTSVYLQIAPPPSPDNGASFPTSLQVPGNADMEMQISYAYDRKRRTSERGSGL